MNSLVSGSDSKKKFLSAVTSFANTSGGHLLIGVKEKRDGDAKMGFAGA